MKDNFPNMVKEIDIQIQEAQESQMRWTKRGPHQDTPQLRCRRLKIKRILKAAREKQTVIYKGVPVRLSVDFSKETLQATNWQEVLKVMKSKDL